MDQSSDEIPVLTPRQRLAHLLEERSWSARELAERLGMSERMVEEHVPHVVRSMSRDRQKRFEIEPSCCRDCGFAFRDRQRVTRPSRCPRCRGESVVPPRFRIYVRDDRPAG
jgi:predicted Zn-ribbon and HTH transcriptional regulator